MFWVLGIRNKVYIIIFTIPHHNYSVLIDGVIYLQFNKVLIFLVAYTGHNLYYTDNVRDTSLLYSYLYTFTLNLNPDFFKPIITFIFTFIPTLISTTMALIEKEQAIIANKYKYRIDVDKATKDKLVEFT